MAVLIVIGIIFIVAFLKYILIIAAIAAGIFLLYLIIKLIVRIISYNKSKKKYEETHYFKDKNIPFKEVYKDKGNKFEIYCYEELKNQLGSDIKILINTLIPRVDSINEYAEIDLIVFHNTGIYVLELKDYNGYVYGNKDNKNWTVGYPSDSKSKNKKDLTINFYNPIMQNEGHITDLRKVFDYNYLNYVVFSSKTIFRSYIDNVTSIDKFIEMLKSNIILSSQEIVQIEKAYLTIKDYDLSSNDNIKKQHIMRQKLNQSKYLN